jgi:hypothetical protein
MGKFITKENIDEYITSYIDNQIKEQEHINEILDFISKDPNVNKKYKNELLTKIFLKNSFKSIDVPSSAVNRINDSIVSLTGFNFNTNVIQNEISVFTKFKEFILTPLTKTLPIPRYALGIFVVIFTIVLFLYTAKNPARILNPFIANGTEKSVMVQAVNNFSKILSGEIKPQIESKSAVEVKNYMKDKVKFDAFIPSISDFEVAGCVCSDYNGQQLAHIIYKNNNNDLIYIYQTDINTIKKNGLDLPDDVHKQIMKDKYYMCDNVSEKECALLMWYVDNLICASVSTLPKQKLYSKFTNLK